MSIEAAIAALQQADLEQLRNEWRRRYGAPPRLRSVTLLRYLLAWRIQSDALGGLGAETRKLLRDVRARREPVVPPGTIIMREWRGVRHKVQATADEFLYAGKRWKSLSEIARAITGRGGMVRASLIFETFARESAALRHLHAQELGRGARAVVEQPRCTR